MIERFLKIKYFYPNEYVKNIFEIDFKNLQDQGIEYVLIDLDNTLIPYDDHQPGEKIISLIERLKTSFKNVVIISNNNENRVKRFCHDIDCDYIFSAKKPLKIGFKRALKILDNPNPNSVVLIGDQFMTDVFGGNRMGFYTIVVDAIKRKTEKWYTKINRYIERKMMRRLEKKDPEFFHLLKLEEKR